MLTQQPHATQMSVGRKKGELTFLWTPRSTVEIAESPTTSSHTREHNPQTMQV